MSRGTTLLRQFVQYTNSYNSNSLKLSAQTQYNPPMIKTRFAPSPTGYLHVGGLRTALYAYLFAKKNKGKFVLRIEDTDQERRVEGAMENLIHTLQWANLDYDEGPYIGSNCGKLKERGDCGPYIQSARTEIYLEHVKILLDSGHAYRCFCTRERLDEMRERQVANKQATMYDRKCCDLPQSEVEKKMADGESFVVRQKMPYDLIKFKDIVRGNVQFHGKTIDDQVLLKSDGFPTYHLANVVDDHSMEITHVIRGEEWLPSTPKHIALYSAFGWEAPEFAHLPLLLNADKTKLSKRQGDVAVEDYMKKGYLKEAILNFVVFLGWNPGAGEEREIFTLEELEEVFSLEKVHKAGAVFDLEKLDWFNWRWQKQNHLDRLEEIAKEIDLKVEITEKRRGQFSYIFTNPDHEAAFAQKRGEIIKEMCVDHLDEAFKEDQELLLKTLVTIEEKILKDPKEVNEHLHFYFKLPDYPKELLTHEKMRVDLSQAMESIGSSIKELEGLEDWRLETLQQILIATVNKLEIKNGQLLWPLRAALSGSQFSPGVFELAWALGKEETLNRLNQANELLRN